MDFQPNFDDTLPPEKKNTSGIALFMVLAAISVLAVLVVEFTYVAQVNQTIAYGALDQAKAHYLAKSGLKLSLLRLKAYQQVKKQISSLKSGAGMPTIPQSLIEKIWNFPFFYPIPSNIPGLTVGEKDAIEKFQKESGLDGKFSAVIQSESSKFNLNFIVAQFAPRPSSSVSPSPTTTPDPSGTGSPTPTPPSGTAATPFNGELARQSLGTFLKTILDQKFEADPDFASSYRDLRIEDMVDNIAAWADPSYERRTSSNQDKIPMKRAPFYSLSELHYLSTFDDDIYNLIAPNLTVSPTGGINVNTIEESTLAALVPSMSKEELKEFFKFRDSEEADNSFKTGDSFFEYLSKNVAAYQNQTTLNQFKEELKKRNLSIVTDESYFKITVQAKVNSATRTLEAWVTLGDATLIQQGQNNRGKSETGLTVTYMRIL